MYWVLKKMGKKCSLCTETVWSNGRWGCVVQCPLHKPEHKHLKFTFTGSGYDIYKVKSHNGKRHVWKKTTEMINLSYQCPCDKCAKSTLLKV
jgi:hypothetical protein